MSDLSEILWPSNVINFQFTDNIDKQYLYSLFSRKICLNKLI
jgi:hypothetical protein